MKDNRGFMITGILYSMLILFSIIIVGLLSVVSTRKNLLNKLGDEMVDTMGVTRSEYRLLTENGTYSDWQGYTSTSDLNISYPIQTIDNAGTINQLFKLYGPDMLMQYDAVNTGIRFNGTSSYLTNKASLTLNGSNSYLEIPYDGGKTLTIEMWAYANSYEGAMLFSFNNTNGPALYFANNVIALSAGDEIENAYENITEYPNIGWHHYAVVIDIEESISNLYIDGVLIGSATYVDPESDKIFIGSSNTGTSNFFNGMIREVRIWDDVRTEEEINANMYRSLSSNEENLKAYHPLSFNTDTTSKAAVGEDGSVYYGTWTKLVPETPNTTKTVYLDFNASSCGRTIFTLDDTTTFSLDDECKYVLTTGSESATISEDIYTVGTRVKLVLVWNETNYDIYLDGEKKTTTSLTNHASELSFSEITLGYDAINNNKFFSGTLHALYMSSSTVSEEDAILLSSGTSSSTLLENSEIKYDYTNYLHTR